MHAAQIFGMCVVAIRDGILIEREGDFDKEFHFQNWFRSCLERLRLKFDSPGRNTYPDFRLVSAPEGYELKGLRYPGRDATYDSNSQLPRGEHTEGGSITSLAGIRKNPMAIATLCSTSCSATAAS
jgi:hypothetical protein